MQRIVSRKDRGGFDPVWSKLGARVLWFWVRCALIEPPIDANFTKSMGCTCSFEIVVHLIQKLGYHWVSFSYCLVNSRCTLALSSQHYDTPKFLWSGRSFVISLFQRGMMGRFELSFRNRVKSCILLKMLMPRELLHSPSPLTADTSSVEAGKARLAIKGDRVLLIFS